MSLDYLFYAPQKDGTTGLKNPKESRYSFAWQKEKRKTVSEIFFTPYEKSKEFEYHFYRTFRSPVLCAIFWALPTLAITLAVATLVGTLMLALFTETKIRDSIYKIAKVAINLVIDLIVAPLSLMILLTRGLATLVSKITPTHAKSEEINTAAEPIMSPTATF